MKVKILGFIAIISSLVVDAQDRVYTLEECRTMAIETNYNLKSSNERVLISKDMLSAYKSNKLPNFSLNGNYLYSSFAFDLAMTGGYLPTFTDGVLNSGTVAYMPNQSYSLEMGHLFNTGVLMTQPIYMGGKVSNAIKLADLGVCVSQLDKQKSEVEVLELVDKAYYKVIEVEEVLKSAQKYQAVVKEFHRQIENAYNQGMKNRNDVMKISVRLNEAELLVQRAKNGLRLAKMNLFYTIGLPLTTQDISLVDPTPIDQVVDVDNLDISSRPEYAMLEKQIEVKKLDVKISRGDFLPSVAALASYNYLNGAKLNDYKLINSATFTGGVTVNVPIFHWGEGRRKISAKQREVTIAQNQMQDLTQQMQLELLQAANNYNESTLEVALTCEALKQAEENMRLSRSQYDNGMETLADYLESQAIWQQSMSNYYTAKSLQRTTYTHYLKCKGELLHY